MPSFIMLSLASRYPTLRLVGALGGEAQGRKPCVRQPCPKAEHTQLDVSESAHLAKHQEKTIEVEVKPPGLGLAWNRTASSCSACEIEGPFFLRSLLELNVATTPYCHQELSLRLLRNQICTSRTTKLTINWETLGAQTLHCTPLTTPLNHVKQCPELTARHDLLIAAHSLGSHTRLRVPNKSHAGSQRMPNPPGNTTTTDNHIQSRRAEYAHRVTIHCLLNLSRPTSPWPRPPPPNRT